MVTSQEHRNVKSNTSEKTHTQYHHETNPSPRNIKSPTTTYVTLTTNDVK